MKTITFPVGYRPGYLKNFLAELEKHDIADYEIVCSAEACQPCIDILENSPLPIKILRKPNSIGRRDHGGARDNMYNVLNHVFTEMNSEFNVHLEDDFILSPDMFDLANWHYKNFKDAPLTYMSYGLFSWASAGEDYEGLTKAESFHGLGWCAFKENWDICYGKYWYDDDLARKYADAFGWDWAMQAAFKEFNWHSLVPSISRTFHDGRIDGTCCTLDFYDKTYTNLVWNKDKVVKDFIIRDGTETAHLYD